jgi:opine dehydrogenase
VARAFGHDLPGLVEEMALIGTADADAAARGDLREAVTNGKANREIQAPDSLEHRYYREDFGFGVVPFLALAEVAGVASPVARALLDLASTLVGADLAETGLDAGRMGIAGLDATALGLLVRGGARAR